MKMSPRITSIPAVIALILLLQSSVLAKLPTVKITVTGPGLASAFTLSDEALLVNVWTGLPQKHGWLAPQPFVGGIVAAPASALPRYTVSFFAVDPTTNQPRVFYRIQFVRDPRDDAGYIFLPSPTDPDGRLNESTIIRSQDGNWTRASAAWSDALSAHLPAQSNK